MSMHREMTLIWTVRDEQQQGMRVEMSIIVKLYAYRGLAELELGINTWVQSRMPAWAASQYQCRRLLAMPLRRVVPSRQKTQITVEASEILLMRNQ